TRSHAVTVRPVAWRTQLVWRSVRRGPGPEPHHVDVPRHRPDRPTGQPLVERLLGAALVPGQVEAGQVAPAPVEEHRRCVPPAAACPPTPPGSVARGGAAGRGFGSTATVRAACLRRWYDHGPYHAPASSTVPPPAVRSAMRRSSGSTRGYTRRSRPASTGSG